uniref:Uncharacterized protein n=1 Tax=Siphoviridae sp. ctAkS7 TaxID=2827798 RepID=A0A8S5SYG4_9CAUD|nr:MAG TPA: hypothetical protein [Siphoviridae sp. ctAkS7]
MRKILYLAKNKLLLAFTILVLILVAVNFRNILWGYYKLIDYKVCQPTEEFYNPQEVTYDNTQFEGYFNLLNNPEAGSRRYCWSYREEKNNLEILKEPVTSKLIVGTNRHKDPELIKLAKQAGIKQDLTYEPVSMYYVDSYDDSVWTQGEYSAFKKAITIKKDAVYPFTTISHEYLHHVWYRDNLESDKRLVDELTGFYRRSRELQDRMSSYQEKEPTEFFSYGCTEWSDRYLTPYIVSQCNKYITRSVLRMTY